jgi:hypothetical protein
VNDLNIYDDSRNRGLEVLLYQTEKNSQINQDEQGKFKLKFTLPLPFGREYHFQFESFIIKRPKISGKK